MIFKNIESINTKIEKKFLIEKVKIMIELVKKYSIANNIDFDNIKIIEQNIIIELISFGIINNLDELNLLKKIISSEYKELEKTLTLHSTHSFEFLNKFSNKYRKKVQLKAESNNKPKIIDLFCGAGGFSLGFISQGFKIELANDIELSAIETYKFNHPDLSSEKILTSDIKEIVNNIENKIKMDIDVIIGGPPCQSFSNANQQRIINDPRNILYKYYVKAVNKVRPKFILMENVRGMKKVSAQVIEDFNKIGYDVKCKVYDSSDFSVPQKRMRLIYVGVNREFAIKKDITPDLLMLDIEKELLNKKRFILQDALSEIKPLICAQIKNITEIDCDKSGKKIDINEYKNNSNKYLTLINMNRRINFVFNHKARFNNTNDQEIYSRLIQGKDSTCDSIKDIMPYGHRSHVFKDKYYKLIESVPCRTITAHMKMDCHSHIHPTQNRGLTPREASRIQSFPDDYLFLGPYLKTYRQIGNAVPPLMSEVFAKVYKKYL